MPEGDLSLLVSGLETNLDAVSGLRVYDKFEGQFAVPAAIVDLPESIDFDLVYQRGGDTWNLNVLVLVSKASERAGRKKLIDYLDGTGATSIKTAIESDSTLGGACDSLRVERAEKIGNYRIQDVDYLGATFVVEVIT